MGRPKKIQEETEEVEVEETIQEEAVEETGSASVYSRNGSFVRTYTSEIHGSNYKTLAKGYASKIGGTVK